MYVNRFSAVVVHNLLSLTQQGDWVSGVKCQVLLQVLQIITLSDNALTQTPPTHAKIDNLVNRFTCKSLPQKLAAIKLDTQLTTAYAKI